jgi:hypothetical protein
VTEFRDYVNALIRERRRSPRSPAGVPVTCSDRAYLFP